MKAIIGIIFFTFVLPVRTHPLAIDGKENGLVRTNETEESFLDELDTWRGVPYRKDGRTRAEGVDAAGLIGSVYMDFCRLTLPGTLDSIWLGNTGITIDFLSEDLMPGDVIFFQNGNRINDAVIYIGDEDEDNIVRVHPANGVQSGKLPDMKGKPAGAKRFVTFAKPLLLRGSGYLKEPLQTGVTRDELIDEIKTWIGTPYAWGSNKKQTGSDCSGFVTSLFRTLFDVSMPRTSSGMWTEDIGKIISDRSALLPGDVLFFTYGNRVGHVAVYIGKNKQGVGEIAHAKNEKEPLGIDAFTENSYWMGVYTGAKRFVLLSDRSEIPAKEKTLTVTEKPQKEFLYKSSQPEISGVRVIKEANRLSVTWLFKNGASEKQIAEKVSDPLYKKTFGDKFPDPVFFRYRYVWKGETHTGTLLEDRDGMLRAEIDENHDTEEIEIFTLRPVGFSSQAKKKTDDKTASGHKAKTEDSSGTGAAIQTGEASYYAHQFHGRKTANGEIFDMNQLTAAHRTLPFGAKVLVTNLQNGKQVVVRINDRGPFVKGRIIDVSYEAAKQLDMIRSGIADVTIERE